MSRELWNSLLDAEMNVRYWSVICHRYSRYDVWSRAFLAITSSSTVASWEFWSQLPWLWKSLSAVSALVAIILSVVDLPKRISRVSVLVARWKHSEVEYQLLWQNDRALSSPQAKSKYRVCKNKEIDTKAHEQTLPRDQKLLKRCYDEVCRALWSEEGRQNWLLKNIEILKSAMTLIAGRNTMMGVRVSTMAPKNPYTTSHKTSQS